MAGPTNSIYTILIARINTLLSSSDKVKEIFSYPEDKYTKYPVAVYYPNNLENSFETNEENFEVHNFKLFLIVNCQQKKKSEIFNVVMPNLIDDVKEKFNNGWSGDVINGHRSWLKIDLATWDTDLASGGEIAFAELNVQIKILTNN